MARLEYPPIDTPEAQRVAEEVKRLRGGRLLNLYRMQLYNPDITSGWLQLGMVPCDPQCSSSRRWSPPAPPNTVSRSPA